MIRNCMLLLLMLGGIFNVSFAQDHIVEGMTPNLYLSHKVAAKETWYSIGRAYGLPAKDIATYNKTTIEKPLEVGQALRIPLTSTNFSQSDPSGDIDKLIPVYHIVGEKEWMYRISVNHNKVPVEKLEKWNGITRDQAKAGTRLIIGYLKTDGSTQAVTPPVTTPTVASKPAEETKKPTPVVSTASKTTATPKTGGYFKEMYEESGKSSSGVAGIFKSTSGWKDGKYYALMSNVVVGTIVKIVFPQTSKVIYAKVLGELPSMKESSGLALRISDAAASELGAENTKFSVDIRY